MPNQHSHAHELFIEPCSDFFLDPPLTDHYSFQCHKATLFSNLHAVGVGGKGWLLRTFNMLDIRQIWVEGTFIVSKLGFPPLQKLALGTPLSSHKVSYMRVDDFPNWKEQFMANPKFQWDRLKI